MISKDLLYALQTRSKKLIHELDKFTNDIKNYSFEDAWWVVTQTIQLVREIPPTQGKYNATIKCINRGWLAFSTKSEAAAHQLYDTIIDELDKTTWTDPDEAQVASQLLYAFYDHQLRCDKEFLSLALRRQSPRILALIERIAPRSEETLFPMPIYPGTGVGADAIHMLLMIYFYHTNGLEDEDLRADAAQLLLPLVRSNSGIGNDLTFYLLQFHPERAAIVSQLIDIYLVAEKRKTLFGMSSEIMRKLLDNDGSSFLYADLDKITALLEVSSKRWTSGQVDTFIRGSFYSWGKTDEDRRLLLTKSKKARRLAAMIIDSGHASPEIDSLRSLHQSIVQQTPAAAPAPSTAGEKQFKDLNFKLLVIEELMYVQELLPRLDVREFAKLYTDREIMIEEEGYDVIPEVLAYFRGLSIPPSLLAQVHKLGFDGSNAVYSQIFPYWDGECDTFYVKSIQDLELVPNLTSMSMPEEFVEKFGAALIKKSIEVDSI